VTVPEKVVIWGAGGQALVVADAINASGLMEIWCFVDDINHDRAGSHIAGFPIMGAGGLDRAMAEDIRYLIVAIGNNRARTRCAERAVRKGFELTTVVHPSAVVASWVEVGKGSYVGAGAIINPGARIGKNVIINTKANVAHHCIVEDGAHICPGVTMGGWVKVGKRAWVGLGSTVRDHVTVGCDSLIGVGASVVKDVEEQVVAYGVPARRVREARDNDGF